MIRNTLVSSLLSLALAAPLAASGTAQHGNGHAAEPAAHADTGHSTQPAAHAPAAATLALGGGELCHGFGPQTPRNIADGYGLNDAWFAYAPPPGDLNLCNIHTHTNAEHMGPGFSVWAGPGDHGGFRCNQSTPLTRAELSRPEGGPPSFEGVEPGDTIEVHWVYTSCDVAPGPGLGSCLSQGCANPTLRVEAQVFLVVNDPNALDFRDFIYVHSKKRGKHQPLALPTGTGTPVVFRGSTTGTKYTQEACSPMQVTWSVRPRCARLNISTLDAWGASHNVFEEHHSHGVRQLVTAPQLLAPIQ